MHYYTNKCVKYIYYLKKYALFTLFNSSFAQDSPFNGLHLGYKQGGSNGKRDVF